MAVDEVNQRTGGITIFRPSTTVSLVILFACLISAVGTLYLALIPESVSPATTVWIMAAPLEAAAGADALVVLGSVAADGTPAVVLSS